VYVSQEQIKVSLVPATDAMLTRESRALTHSRLRRATMTRQDGLL